MASGQNRQFEPIGMKRAHWSNAGPIRTIFREAFKRAGLPYFNPHSLRKTLTRLGGEICHSVEEYKAWSQNSGHEQVLTTLMSYGKVATERQGDIIRGIGLPKPSTQPAVDDLAEALLKKLQGAGAVLPAGQ
jgi:integrase